MRPGVRFAVLTAVFVLAFGLLPIPAAAATCVFAPPLVTVDVGAGETATIGRSGNDITVNGVACGGATVANTDTIAVTTTGVPTEIAIDLTAGPLAPGLTPEADGSEIEITIDLSAGTPTLRILGSSVVDRIVAGASGVNLNSDETTADADITITGTPSLVIEGGDGDDVLSLGGGAGTGAGRQGSLLGQAGNDRLLGGVAGSIFDGGDGIDTIDYSAASAMNVDLRAGSAVGDGTDGLSSIENVIGSPLADHLVGDGGANLLDGGPGDDKIDGGGGDDTLFGRDGSDTVSFQSATEGVTVSLTRGTAEGSGADTLEGFENVVGTPKADEIRGDGERNRLDGRRGPDQVYGGGGADIILGGDGNDLLFGQSGNDTLLGDSAKDRLDGGKDRDVCKGGTGPDSFVFCETINAGPP